MRTSTTWLIVAAMMASAGCRAGFPEAQEGTADIEGDGTDANGGDVGGSDGRDVSPDVGPAECGDGVVQPGEACDDGRTDDGDGCSAACKIEPGWLCVGAPSDCDPRCGDGKIVADEACDDGDVLSGDGCSSECEVEDGWLCESEPSRCTEDCGDGKLVGDEECEDGGAVDGDGCSAQCRFEEGWVCEGEPTAVTCVTECGDGITAGDEECDDATPGEAADGCVDCQVQEGWACNQASPSVCTNEQVCGDGIVVGDEQCDDGGQADGDGCDKTCVLEDGWSCSETAPTTCEAVCGDGMVLGDETCDLGPNGATTNAAACVDCQVQEGWACDGEPSTCASVCGDGKKVGGEQCDDGGTAPNDGCSADCQLEEGFACFEDPVAGFVCETDCGDGIVAGDEECDDGETGPGDGCDQCLVEYGWICSGSPSVCGVPCGDGITFGAEECDDANDALNDGCTPDCQLEDGFTCDTTQVPTVCSPEGCDPVETCNGVDDDCDGETDEGADEPCYTGDASQLTPGAACQMGVRACVGGTLSDVCEGEILPGEELCNGLDDDCNGQIDDGMPTVTCGLGVCATQVSICSAGGTGTACASVPPQGAVDTCGNGLDDDCDGQTDEDCECIYVLAGPEEGEGTKTSPKGSIAAAIAAAVDADGETKNVCVASTGGCSSQDFPSTVVYSESVVMADGVNVIGGYDATTWTRDLEHCVVEIKGSGSQPVVTFESGITTPTSLDGVMVKSVSGASEHVAVRIAGAPGARLVDTVVIGSSAETVKKSIGVDIENVALNAGGPIIERCRIEGGGGADLSIGVRVWDASPILRDNCSQTDGSGRCVSGCNAERGIRAWGGGKFAKESYAVRLESAPGTSIDTSALCAQPTVSGAGLVVTGAATGTRMTRSRARSVGGTADDFGVLLQSCGGASPWIAGNADLVGHSDEGGSAAGVEALGDCHPRIEDNTLIVGGDPTSKADVAIGVKCGVDAGHVSRCEVVGNAEIRGTMGGSPAWAAGVVCDGGACERIQGNAIAGDGGGTTTGVALLGPTDTFIDGNTIEGGCAGSGEAVGIASSGASPRVQNNVVVGRTCSQAGASFGMWADLGDDGFEPDVHSNLLRAGGAGECVGAALAVDRSDFDPPGPVGIVRNNLLDAGGCSQAAGIFELDAQADPRVVENNAMVAMAGSANGASAWYVDEVDQLLTTAVEVDALLDIQASGNLAQICPLAVSGAAGVSLPLASPCVDAGTKAGAPSYDIDKDPRPQGVGFDIGPDEVKGSEPQPLPGGGTP